MIVILQPNSGGSVLAHNTSLSELYDRVSKDSFVAENVVNTEIPEIYPEKSDDRPIFWLVNENE